jgi:hypothetical protein
MKSKVRLIKVIVVLIFLTSGILLAQTYQGKNWILSGSMSGFEGIKQQTPPSVQSVEFINRKEPQSDRQMEDIYKEEIIRLRQAGDSGNLQDLLTQAQKIENLWGAKGGKYYGLFWVEFLSVLTSKRFNEEDNKILELSQKYVIQALSKADTFSYDTEWNLIMFLRTSFDEAKSGNGSGSSLQKVELWLHLVRRSENEKDSNFDPADMPFINVPLPKGATGVAGMSPENIQDLKLRAEYEKAIDANTRKTQYYSHQVKLRQDEDFIIKGAVKYIAREYSYTPNNLPELSQLLESFGISVPLSSRILNQTKSLITDK